jgi:hypothetical protein
MPTQPTFTCATCDAEIAHHPVFHLGLAFCCAGCAADGPCMCSYDVAVEHAAAVVPAVAAVRTRAGLSAGVPATATAAAPVPPSEPASPPDVRRRSGERHRSEEPTLVNVRS